jgi:C-terminal processing protease CtpA/Prc
MKQQMVSLVLILVIGVFIGVTLVGNNQPEVVVQSLDSADFSADSYPDVSLDFDSPNEDIKKLHQRITKLEQSIIGIHSKLENFEKNKAKTHASTEANIFSRAYDPLTKRRLTDAGIDDQLAADIIQQQDESEYKKLDLKDRAVREGFINTPRYRKELRALNTQVKTLRKDLGDDTYDRYLYASGRPNRVSVISVMQGSPADQAGFETDDMILSYADNNVFQWNEINKLSTQGLRGESIIVNVLRNGELLSISVPRGPLGVKLKPAVSEPLGSSFY